MIAWSVERQESVQACAGRRQTALCRAFGLVAVGLWFLEALAQFLEKCRWRALYPPNLPTMIPEETNWKKRLPGPMGNVTVLVPPWLATALVTTDQSTGGNRSVVA